MIPQNSPFEYLRQFKEVDDATEKLVVKKTIGKVEQKELAKIFEKGIAGEYGKVYTLDPQTILGWVEKYQKGKYSNKNYLEAPIYPVHKKEDGSMSMNGWRKEANKCYRSFLNGVSHENFHHHVYDRMMLDYKIKTDAYKKYFNSETQDIHEAQRMILRDIFQDYKERAYTEVYFFPQQ